MSVRTPPTLLKLARQALLRDEALAVSALEELPMELCPALFREAFHGGQARMVQAMVEAWPFPCLPVGALMETPNLETFQAVLDGVDMQLTGRLHPRRKKLQVLDLRKVHHEFWNIWDATEGGGCSAETAEEKRVVKVLPRYALRQRLTVVADLCVRFRLDQEQACLLQWAQQRQGSLRFCCQKLKIQALPFCATREVLKAVRPEYIEILELNVGWDVFALARFAPFLGRMRSLGKLSLARVYKNTFKIAEWTRDREEKCVGKFISQFSKFSSLQHLSMNGVYFLRDHMTQLLRGLKMPLETFSITHFQFSQADLNSLPRCQKLFQLRHLDLRGMVLLGLEPEPLRDLLEKAADTLQSLDLEGCRMTDSQLTVLTPALSRCSQLAKINLCDNDISMGTLRDLLYHTANLREMTMEQYPVPLECYDDFGYVLVGTFVQLCPQLMDALRAVRQPKMISFASDLCHECRERCVYDQGSRLCACWR